MQDETVKPLNIDIPELPSFEGNKRFDQHKTPRPDDTIYPNRNPDDDILQIQNPQPGIDTNFSDGGRPVGFSDNFHSKNDEYEGWISRTDSGRAANEATIFSEVQVFTTRQRPDGSLELDGVNSVPDPAHIED